MVIKMRYKSEILMIYDLLTIFVIFVCLWSTILLCFIVFGIDNNITKIFSVAEFVILTNPCLWIREYIRKRIFK